MPPAVQAAILGVVQGVTEFLPVSSTAHLLVVGRLLGFSDPGGTFTVMIQLGSIFAIMWVYRAKILEVVVGLPSSPQARRFALMLFVALLPAVVAGAAFSRFITEVLYTALVVNAVTFIAGGVVILLVERYQPRVTVSEVDATPIGKAFGIGCCQALAIVPGTSRSGATIVGGMLLGLDRAVATEFSFFLAMPTLAAAFVNSLWKVRHEITSARTTNIAIGLVMAFISSALVVKPFLNYVRRSGFQPFAWYRIVFGVVLLAALAAGWGR
ncbi:MAG TPA: undecaprenyl-diphosphate phosphatase [Vicinamibacterales bacterium]|nr:undecaprenyl-diphosphate phosphatase [Vicinamibacterales bacterium]